MVQSDFISVRKGVCMKPRFEGGVAIHYQISKRIEEKILSGELSLGEQLPTVRNIAKNMSVNPNTVQKALSNLETEGLIVTDSTVGKFVTDDKKLVVEHRKAYLENMISEFLENLKKIGVEDKELIHILKENIIDFNL